MPDGHEPNINRCVVKVAGSAGAAFVAIAQCVDSLVLHLFGPGAFWLIAAPILAGLWAVEYFCVNGDESD